MTTEAKILKRAKTRANELGLRVIRLAMRPGVEVGWPDLLVMAPNRHLLGMELKRPGKHPTPVQIERGRLMVAYGFAWAKCDTEEDVDFTLENFARMSIGARTLTKDEMRRNDA